MLFPRPAPADEAESAHDCDHEDMHMSRWHARVEKIAHLPALPKEFERRAGACVQQPARRGQRRLARATPGSCSTRPCQSAPAPRLSAKSRRRFPRSAPDSSRRSLGLDSCLQHLLPSVLRPRKLLLGCPSFRELSPVAARTSRRCPLERRGRLLLHERLGRHTEACMES